VLNIQARYADRSAVQLGGGRGGRRFIEHAMPLALGRSPRPAIEDAAV